jgi:hypothetical protein
MSNSNPKTFQHFLTTVASVTQCHKCNKAMWAAVVNGFAIKVDTTPLNAGEEIEYRLAGIRIWQTRRIGGKGFELQRRTTWHITHSTPDVYALAEHTCNRGLGAPAVNFYEKNQMPTEMDF